MLNCQVPTGNDAIPGTPAIVAYESTRYSTPESAQIVSSSASECVTPSANNSSYPPISESS